MAKFTTAALLIAFLALGACASRTVPSGQATRISDSVNSPDSTTTLRYTDTGRATPFWANDR